MELPIKVEFSGKLQLPSELKKVTWPTRREALRLTILVLMISGIIGAILSLIDIGFAELFKFLTES